MILNDFKPTCVNDIFSTIKKTNGIFNRYLKIYDIYMFM